MTFFTKNVSLLPYNTFGVEATAAYFCNWHNDSTLIDAVERCKSNKIEWRVLGGGSNTLLTGDYCGAVLHPTTQGIDFGEGDDLVVAEAGVEWDNFVAWCVGRDLAGVENLSYIPGLVGASPVQNIGAYGAEAAQSIEWVEYLDTQTMLICRKSREECNFGYRDSIFKNELKQRAIIIRVAYRLSSRFDASAARLDYGDLRSKVEQSNGGITLKNIRQAVTEIRRAKLPDPADVGNAGSFFKNPVISAEKFAVLQANYPDIPSFVVADGIKVPSGWLIERAGWRGFSDGVVGVHPRQALVLVNYGGATADDILSLARRIKCDIVDKFGIEISMEVNIL